MERLRTDLLRRARSDRPGTTEPQSDHGQAATQEVEMEQQNQGTGGTWRHLPRFNTLSRALGSRNQNVEGPKSPDLNQRPLTTTSSHYSDRYLPAHSVSSPSSAASFMARGNLPSPPEPVEIHRANVQSEGGTSPIQRPAFHGRDPAVSNGASTEASSQSNGTTHEGDEERGGRPHPKHFLFCFPWIKSRRVRSQLLTSVVSGIFLCSLVAICKSSRFGAPTGPANTPQTWA